LIYINGDTMKQKNLLKRLIKNLFGMGLIRLKIKIS